MEPEGAQGPTILDVVLNNFECGKVDAWPYGTQARRRNALSLLLAVPSSQPRTKATVSSAHAVGFCSSLLTALIADLSSPLKSAPRTAPPASGCHTGAQCRAPIPEGGERSEPVRLGPPCVLRSSDKSSAKWARRRIIFFAATKVRIISAKRIEQPRSHLLAQCQPKSLPQLDVGNAAARTRTVSAAPFRPNRQKFARQNGRILIPTDSAVRVLPPQPRSRSPRSVFRMF
jgi:hypothetical protein